MDLDAYGFVVAMTCASTQCILKMEFGAIARPKGRRKAALSIARVAFPKLPFGEKGDTQRVRQMRGDRETRDAPTYDSHVVRVAVRHCQYPSSLTKCKHNT